LHILANITFFIFAQFYLPFAGDRKLTMTKVEREDLETNIQNMFYLKWGNLVLAISQLICIFAKKMGLEYLA